MAQRLLPVVDEHTAPFWEATARHALVLARCSSCNEFSHPPESICPRCLSTDPRFTFRPAGETGTVRSWTVVRQSFLPGFEVPFVLVDVELDEQRELRMIGRLLDGQHAQLRLGAPVRLAFEDLTDDIAVPAFVLSDPA